MCGPPGPLNEPRLIMSHMPVSRRCWIGAVRVVVVVRDAEVVRQLVRVGRHAGALGLDRRVARRVRPDASTPDAHEVHGT